MKDVLRSKNGWTKEEERKGRREEFVYLGRGAIGITDFLKLNIKNTPISYVTSDKYFEFLLLSLLQNIYISSHWDIVIIILEV